MSKREYYDTTLDQIYKSHDVREPTYKVVIWNPNRCSVQDVVLSAAESPEYDISDHVKQIEYKENIVFENSDDAVATNCVITLTYNPNRSPIPIDQTTLLDSTPIRIYQSDHRTSAWILIFTGVIRGNPSVMVYEASGAGVRDIQILAVGRAEQYLNRVVTARSYAQDTDIGKAAVETAIEYAYLDRREIDIGYQDYALGHSQNQLVDIEVLKGIAQMLFCVGKKPRFDSRGHLIAADADLSKTPARTYGTRDLFTSIQRIERQESIYNSVRLLGLDNELSLIVEREKRLAHGSITSGFFDSHVRQDIWFSESEGQTSGGRKARNTRIVSKLHSMGDVGGSLTWSPALEDDGFTCFGGQLTMDTGYAPWVYTAITSTYALAAVAELSFRLAGVEYIAFIFGMTRITALVGLIVAMQALGRVDWEIYGEPIQYVYQQLCATAQLSGVLSADVRELERRNDWIYNIDVLQTRAEELLKRELIKGWSYEIIMLDDPILEVDDIIDIVGEKYYITSITKTLNRTSASPVMQVSAWRVL